jgi:guanine deaminase
LKVCLGSDIAGGYALGIQQQMRQSVIISRLRDGLTPSSSSKRVDWIESLYVGTRAGKKALRMGGVFEVGMEFDAQLSDLLISRS